MLMMEKTLIQSFSDAGSSISSKTKSIIISSSFSEILSGCIFTGVICLTWHLRKDFWSLFFMLISPYFELLISAGDFM